MKQEPTPGTYIVLVLGIGLTLCGAYSLWGQGALLLAGGLVCLLDVYR